MTDTITMDHTAHRIFSLDLLRGLVMVIMALDHTRDYFHFDAFIHEPLDVKTTTAGLYFTRWITHYCAPIFVFLAGISIYLQSLRKPAAELSAFLFKRGVWLLFVEVIIITYLWTFDPAFQDIIVGVIWAIGCGMILMSMVIKLPFRVVFGLGLIIVLGHNIFDFIASTHTGFFWDLLRNGNFAVYPMPTGREFNIIYPILPWFGLMVMGFYAGMIFNPSFDQVKRKKMLTTSGFGLIAAFLVIRWINIYGDPHPWQSQSTSLMTFLSFLNVHKYPPSLLYMCITIGPALLFLSVSERSNGTVSRIIQVYGRVPFLYYVLHFLLLHVICMILFVQRGHAITEQTPEIFGIKFNYVLIGEGYSLTVVYLIWIGVVAALYPVCKWFGDLKKVNKSWWLSYL